MVPHNKKVLFVVFSSAVQFKFLEELRFLLLAVAVSSADDTQEDRMRDNLLTGEGGWERAKSYDGEKA